MDPFIPGSSGRALNDMIAPSGSDAQILRVPHDRQPRVFACLVSAQRADCHLALPEKTRVFTDSTDSVA